MLEVLFLTYVFFILVYDGQISLYCYQDWVNINTKP